MNLVKKLLEPVAALLINFFVFNLSICSISTPIAKDAAPSSLEEIMHVTLINSSKYDFFISMKQSETFVLNASIRHNRIGSVGEVQFFAKKLPSSTFTQIPFCPADFLKNIIARIWLVKEEASIDFYYKNLFKKSVIFLIQPKLLTGLQSITICIEDDNVAEYMYYNFTNNFKCGICKGQFVPGQILTILDCGCVFHQECFHTCDRSIQCPQCHNPVIKHEFQSCPCVYEVKSFLGPVSRLINDTDDLKTRVLKNNQNKATSQKNSARK
ncbi:MAG: hypothetical protein V1646_03860 [bacterium]